MDILFTDVLGVDPGYAPEPAVRQTPDWYKATASYVDGQRVIRDGDTPHTIKKCVPVFDAMTAGYIIRTYVDVQVTQRDGAPWYEWPSHNAVAFHPVTQAALHPSCNEMPYPKWNNPWAIRTPRGYSTLFVPPMHNPNGMFTVLPGLVDTDVYHAPVNFPFVLNDARWEGIIPAGTPMVQIIPIKRDPWKMRIGGPKDVAAQNSVSTKLRALWFNSYKRQFWNRKEYR